MAKIKFSNFSGARKKMTKDARKQLNNAVYKGRDEIESEIISTILQGQSPVKGKRFKQYNKEYADRKKGGSRRPVDMMITGDMLDSLTTKRLPRQGGINFLFDDEAPPGVDYPLSIIHNTLGAGVSKVIRRLLPNFSKGETFKSNILKVIRKVAQRGFK